MFFMAANGKRARDADAALKDVAQSFRCSITSTLMVDPVSTSDGQLYERQAIHEWLAAHNTSPNTGSRLTSKTLIPSPAIRTMVERLVYSGCLSAEETREWLLRRALAHLASGERDKAQPLLERALVEGEAAAGYHLGRLLVDRAAEAGVPQAIAVVSKLGPLAGTRIRSCDEVKLGDMVKLLPEAETRAATAAAAGSRVLAPGVTCWEHKDERDLQMCGQILKVTVVDKEDQTLKVLHVSEELGNRDGWFPIEAFLRA